MTDTGYDGPIQHSRWSVEARRIIVMDTKSSCCLFDFNLSWRIKTSSHKLCALIMSFLQFAQTSKAGALSSAQFTIHDERMQMLVGSGSRVLVALFHDYTNPAMYARQTAERIVRGLLTTFERRYAHDLQSMSYSYLRQGVEGVGDAERSIRETFQEFEGSAREMVDKFAGPATRLLLSAPATTDQCATTAESPH